jgi:hypothetical protein
MAPEKASEKPTFCWDLQPDVLLGLNRVQQRHLDTAIAPLQPNRDKIQGWAPGWGSNR